MCLALFYIKAWLIPQLRIAGIYLQVGLETLKGYKPGA